MQSKGTISVWPEHPMRSADEVEYLGMAIDRLCLTNSKTRKRIATARQVIHALRVLGLFQQGIHPVKSIRFYKALVQSRRDNGVHLVPWNKGLTKEVNEVERMLFTQLFGKAAAKQADRFRATCWITKLQHRGSLLCGKMVLRFVSRKADLKKIPSTDKVERTCRLVGII